MTATSPTSEPVRADFPGDGARARVTVVAIAGTGLRIAADDLLIIYVLRGTLRVRASFKDLALDTGDFVVINRGDPYALAGSTDNITAIVSMTVANFTDVDPFCDTIIFTCESFGLARYRRQETVLRSMLLAIVEAGLDDAAADQLDIRCTDLLAFLCSNYCLENYYNHGQVLTAAQRQRLHTIMKSMRTHMHRRDAMQVIAAEHHYSKSYVSHLIKDLCGLSFMDHLTTLRVLRAETLLLTTDATTADIAAICGFSHVKYFTRGFQDWFGQSPSQFRARYRPDMWRDDDVAPADVISVRETIREHRLIKRNEPNPPRLSITPVLLKTAGSRIDLFGRVRTFGGGSYQPLNAESRTHPRGSRHLIPICVDAENVDSNYLLDGLASFDRIHATPCLVLEFTGKTSSLELVDRLAARLTRAGANGALIWLLYPGMHARTAVEQVVETTATRHGLTVNAILMA